MQLKPEFLPVGSIVSYNCGSEQFPDWQPTRLDWQDLKWLNETPIEFNAVHEGIPLTPEILTEWCLFKYIKEVGGYCNDLHLVYKTVNGYRFIPYCTDNDDSGTEINYLHELQLLFLAHKQPLQITIK